MCMEDVIIGREKKAAMVVIQITPIAAVPLCLPNASRTHLMIGTSGNGVIIGPTVNGDPTNQGYTLASTMPVFELDIEQHGDAVRQGWTGASAGGNVNVLVIETFLGREK